MANEIYIYNEEFFLYPRLKVWIKKFFGRPEGGPKAVFGNLLLGLQEAGKSFKVNEPLPQIADTVCVLSGPSVLRWAILQKVGGKIKRLVAGPNVVLTPLDYNRLIMSPLIDKYIVPAKWSVEWWSTFDSKWAKKLAVWPAGVIDMGRMGNVKGQLSIFYKSGNYNIAQKAYELGKQFNLNPKIIFYGKFKHSEYLELLRRSKIIVYISESESQGLALHEAWMAGVPTLVWNGGGLKLGSYRFDTPNISAPYMTEQCGWFFSGIEDLQQKWPEFLKAYENFSPRAYSLSYFTTKITAENFLKIIG